MSLPDEINILKRQYNNIISLDSIDSEQSQYQDTEISFPIDDDEVIPHKIQQMRKLYERGKDTYKSKAKNFYNQGKFMEDYEDNYIYSGRVYSYFSTYNELYVPQLREYFTWRANIRKGNYKKIIRSSAYMYVFELLNGIGTVSADDSLAKLKEFEEKYILAGIDNDKKFAEDLKKWMYEFAVISDLPVDTVKKFANPEIIEQDRAISILQYPNNRSDREVFDALSRFCPKQLSSSLVIKKHQDEGIHLFAEVWRKTALECNVKGTKLFYACFSGKRAYRWYPLESAVYYNRNQSVETSYVLSDVRDYIYKDEAWVERSFVKAYFDKKPLEALIQETERKLREYFKTGHPLKKKIENSWASLYIDSVIEKDRQTKLEATKIKIDIDISNLDKIRQDATHTMNSLLIEEEPEFLEKTEDTTKDIKEEKTIVSSINNEIEIKNYDTEISLDNMQIKILKMLLKNQSIKELLEQNRILAEVVADSINESLFDDIGDTVVGCDGQTITIVEEYREEISKMLGGI